MFDLFAQILQAILSLVPRLIIVRATHRGIKWRRGHTAVEMAPGLHWYWPLVTEVELVVVARQTLNTPSQALLTSDQKQVTVGGVVVYRINNAVLAYGEKNWDVDSTISDITQAAIVRIISKWPLEYLMKNLCDAVEKELTEECRKELRPFGLRVQRAAFTDFTTCKMIKLFMDSGGVPSQEE